MAKRRALKKLLSLTMALSLAMSLLNVSVFAADGDETAHQHNQMTCPACDGEAARVRWKLKPIARSAMVLARLKNGEPALYVMAALAWAKLAPAAARLVIL